MRRLGICGLVFGLGTLVCPAVARGQGTVPMLEAPPGAPPLGAAAQALLSRIARAACPEQATRSALCTLAQSGSASLEEIRAAAVMDLIAAAGDSEIGRSGRLAVAALTGASDAELAGALGSPECARALASDPSKAQEIEAARQRLRDAHGSDRAEAALALATSAVAMCSELSSNVEAAAPVIRALTDPKPARAAEALATLSATDGGLLLRIVALETDADVKALARSLLVPLPPWTDHFLFDVNGSLPLVGDETRLDGDLLVGYAKGSVYISGFGSAFHHSYAPAPDQRTLVDRYAGSLDVAWLPALATDVRLELRARGGVTVYDSGTSGRIVVGTGTVRPDETSLVGHGVASAGLSVRAGSRVALSASAGGGVQGEDFSAVDATGTSLIVRNESPVTVRGEGRARAQWNAVPSYLSLRARFDANVLSLTTTKDATSVGATSPITSVRDVQSFTQLELMARLFVDVDALAFLDFRPSAHVGVNVFSSEAFSSVVPLVGIGLRREAF